MDQDKTCYSRVMEPQIAFDLKVAKITVRDETYVRYRKNRQFYPASLTLELCPREWKQCLANVRLASPTEQQWKQC